MLKVQNKKVEADKEASTGLLTCWSGSTDGSSCQPLKDFLL